MGGTNHDTEFVSSGLSTLVFAPDNLEGLEDVRHMMSEEALRRTEKRLTQQK